LPSGFLKPKDAEPKDFVSVDLLIVKYIEKEVENRFFFPGYRIHVCACQFLFQLHNAVRVTKPLFPSIYAILRDK